MDVITGAIAVTKAIDATQKLIQAVCDHDKAICNHPTITKHWLKSVESIDKSTTTGYSLIGEFHREDAILTPGLYLISINYEFTAIRKFQTPLFTDEKEGRRRPETDEAGNYIWIEAEKTISDRRHCTVLLDCDGSNLEEIYCAWMPVKWARHLWKPISNWLEQQPNIEEKVSFWERELELRRASAEEAERRLEALKSLLKSEENPLDPVTAEWLKTGAVLGGKKKRSAEAPSAS